MATMTQKLTTKINFSELEELFTKNTDAFTPSTMEQIFFGVMPAANEPTILSKERYYELRKNNIGLIAFVPRTPAEIMHNFENKTSDHKESLYDLSDEGIDSFFNSNFFRREKPRSGLCLMSIGCIPFSSGYNFLGETQHLVDYVEEVLPEIVPTAFWKQCKTQFKYAEPEIKRLMGNIQNYEAVQILQKLLINQYFRPTFAEVTQHMIAYERKYGTKMYHEMRTRTNSLYKKEFFMTIGDHPQGGIVMDEKSVQSGKKLQLGYSFFCSLDWLAKIM